MILAYSFWRKAVALIILMVGFVFIYETRIFDSQYFAIQKLLAERGTPPPGSRLTFTATAYCKGSTTASGVTARTGVAAADPQLLPVGSVVNVAAGVAKYSGVYTIMDTGPEVQGRELDLYMWSCNEALVFGRKAVDITVLRLGWDPQASSPRLIDRLFRRREATRKIPDPEPAPAAGFPPPQPPADSVPAVSTPAGDPRSEPNSQ